MTTPHPTLIPALVLSMLPLAGQAPVRTLTPDVEALYVLPLDGLKKVTHSSFAYGAGLGVTLDFKDAPTMRLGLNHLRMPGKDFGTIKSSLADTQFVADFYFLSGLKRWKAFGGLSLNHYTAKNSGTEQWQKVVYRKPSATTTTTLTVPLYVWSATDTKGIKMGLRLGVEYLIRPRWVATATLQATELQGGPGRKPWEPQPTMPNNGVVNPSWVQFGMRYSF